MIQGDALAVDLHEEPAGRKLGLQLQAVDLEAAVVDGRLGSVAQEGVAAQLDLVALRTDSSRKHDFRPNCEAALWTQCLGATRLYLAAF